MKLAADSIHAAKRPHRRICSTPSSGRLASYRAIALRGGKDAPQSRHVTAPRSNVSSTMDSRSPTPSPEHPGQRRPKLAAGGGRFGRDATGEGLPAEAG